MTQNPTGNRNGASLVRGLDGDIRAVARGAVFGRGLVEQNGSPIHDASQFVAGFAAHVAMRAPQRKSGPGVMIEQGRFPLQAVVTVRARRLLAFRKLPAVNVLVALFARRRRCFEICVNQLGTHVRRLVAVDAGRGAMSSEQREGRL